MVVVARETAKTTCFGRKRKERKGKGEREPVEPGIEVVLRRGLAGVHVKFNEILRGLKKG